jgi:hypothetical protein
MRRKGVARTQAETAGPGKQTESSATDFTDATDKTDEPLITTHAH